MISSQQTLKISILYYFAQQYATTDMFPPSPSFLLLFFSVMDRKTKMIYHLSKVKELLFLSLLIKNYAYARICQAESSLALILGER